MERPMDFPMELVVEILSWLPAESLLRFKCVCKSWYALINGGDFVAKHHRNLNKISSDKSFFFINYGWRTYTRPEKLFLTIREDGDDDHIKFVIENSMSPLFQLYKEYARPFLGCHCNGIFCLYSCVSKKVLLCNPTTKECRFLPNSSAVDDYSTAMLGFGCVNGFYKVVRVSTREGVSFVAEVYTFGTSSWREIEMNVLESEQEIFQLVFASLKNTFQEQCCRGVYYWLFSLSSEKEMMISFDMCEEEFRRVALPDRAESRGYLVSTSLQTWNDSLALLYCPGCSDTIGSIEMWVMSDSAVCADGHTGPRSWTKYRTFGPLEGIWCPLAFWKSDELLMRAKDEGVVSYNLHTQKLRSASTLVSPVDFAHIYLKTLVSVY
ncbi:F-box/kelch-repeat protein At3g23880 [Morus notabilis]|uniref:F-box/kelch-repeat protein At3g23880 n=1 Tax=Morus notabilis TaxID=981085 RepID=UPI000CED2EF5|nr:F-box/kelch-repeat protein At3g23880 [Morus notabilis]